MAALFPMIKISTAYLRLLIAAYGEPHLRLVSFLQIIGCTLPAHLRRDPTGVKRVGVNLRPLPCYRHAKHQHVQLIAALTCVRVRAAVVEPAPDVSPRYEADGLGQSLVEFVARAG